MKKEVLIDARWLEPPEPMEKVLAVLSASTMGGRVRFLIHREPLPLYPILKQMGYDHRTRLLPDGSYEVLIEQI